MVFGKGENGNFTRLYWAIRGHKFAYPGRKDTIKACIYVKELVRFMLYRLEHHEHGVELYNCCFEPAYTIQHIVEAMKKVTGLTQFVPDIPNWVIMPMARAAMLLGSPMGICPARVKKLQISTNICGEKLKNCGYLFEPLRLSFQGEFHLSSRSSLLRREEETAPCWRARYRCALRLAGHQSPRQIFAGWDRLGVS